MSRSVSVAALVLTAAVSYGLYHLSYEVQRLEDELIDYNRALLRDREAIQVLQAEWSYLTRPEVLQERANRNLQLQPLLPKQIATIEQIPKATEPQHSPPALVSNKPAVGGQAPAQAAKPRAPAAEPAKPAVGDLREASVKAPSVQDRVPLPVKQPAPKPDSAEAAVKAAIEQLPATYRPSVALPAGVEPRGATPPAASVPATPAPAYRPSEQLPATYRPSAPAASEPPAGISGGGRPLAPAQQLPTGYKPSAAQLAPDPAATLANVKVAQ